MLHEILKEIVLVIGVSALTVFLLRKVRVPETAGFILAGIIIGPGGVGLITDRQGIEMLAEIGVIFLLFTVGLKLSPRDLWRMKSVIFGMGSLQVVLCIAVTLVAAGALAHPPHLSEGILWGCLFALSSTAMVLRLLEARGETHSPAGRSMLGILLFQDLAVVPMLVALPLLAHHDDGSWREVGVFLVESVAILVVAIVAARFVFPWITKLVVRSRSRELFTLTTILVALGTALLVGELGLSMALGAFLAGIVVSESEYSQQTLAEMIPLRDAFSGLFFVSIGMLVDPALWLQRPIASAGMMAAVVVAKAVLVGAIALLFRRGLRSAVVLGLGLCHIGEFSFVVAHEALRVQLFDHTSYGLFLAVAAPTMILTPFVMAVAPGLAAWLERTSLLSRFGRAFVRSKHVGTDAAQSNARDERLRRQHVIIIGYGINGQNVARILRLLDVPYVVLELNAATVKAMRENGESIHYGDGCREAALRQVGIEHAQALVVATADAPGARQIVAIARVVNPNLTIIVRTRFIQEVDALQKVGADHVIPEEFETSLELVSRVMKIYGAPERTIEREKSALRKAHYEFFRGDERTALVPPMHALLTYAEVDEIIVTTESLANGRSLRDLHLRERTGATVIAVRRKDQNIPNPDAGTTLMSGDVLYLFGDGPALAAARALLSPPDS